MAENEKDEGTPTMVDTPMTRYSTQSRRLKLDSGVIVQIVIALVTATAVCLGAWFAISKTVSQHDHDIQRIERDFDEHVKAHAQTRDDVIEIKATVKTMSDSVQRIEDDQRTLVREVGKLEGREDRRETRDARGR